MCYHYDIFELKRGPLVNHRLLMTQENKVYQSNKKSFFIRIFQKPDFEQGQSFKKGSQKNSQPSPAETAIHFVSYGGFAKKRHSPSEIPATPLDPRSKTP